MPKTSKQIPSPSAIENSKAKSTNGFKKNQVMQMQWCVHTYINFIYLFHIVKNVSHSVLSYTTHSVCLSTACLSICKNACWWIKTKKHLKEIVNMEFPFLLEKKKKGKKLTVDATNNRKSNFFSSFFIHLPCWAISPKYSIYSQKESNPNQKKGSTFHQTEYKRKYDLGFLVE